MASDFAKAGRYNWFRGQLQEWEPASTLERALKRGELHENLLADLNRFHTWCKREPELKHLCEPENIDAFYAIRQHFGFPTAYIDFSTKPAQTGIDMASKNRIAETGMPGIGDLHSG